MTMSASDEQALRFFLASDLGSQMSLEQPVKAYGSESHFCFRSCRNVGFKFILEWSSIYLFSHIWSLSEDHCPLDYKNKAGKEVLILLKSALSRVGVDAGAFTAEMHRLKGKRENVEMMIKISTRLIADHLDLIERSLPILFPKT